MCTWGRDLSVSPRPCSDLSDVTLAGEYINSILTNNVKRAIQGKVTMHVTQNGGQKSNLFVIKSTNTVEVFLNRIFVKCSRTLVSTLET